MPQTQREILRPNDDIYDASYWYKKASMLMKEKKKHNEETTKARQELKII